MLSREMICLALNFSSVPRSIRVERLLDLVALEDEPEHERGHDRHERLADQNGGHNVCDVGLGCGAGDDGSLRRDGCHTSGHQTLLTDQDEHRG